MNEQIVYGIHAVKALLNNVHRKIKNIYINSEKQNKNIQDIIDCVVQKKHPVEFISGKEFSNKFPNIIHQGVVALAEKLPEYEEKDLDDLLMVTDSKRLILILDGITDPHNLGACLRSADAAGVNFVVIPKDKNVGITSTVSKVSCGAAESIPLVRVTNLARSIETLQQAGIWVYGAAGEAEKSIYEMNFSGDIGIVMGAEEKGLRHLTRERCDGLFSLPMLGSVSSLNVSVATGICLYEAVRQNSKK